MEMNLEDFILDPVDPLNETIMNNWAEDWNIDPEDLIQIASWFI
jgi:hypothetical protein